MIKASDLRIRDVINIVDGKRLGLMNDLEVDLDSGTITALIIPGPARFFGLLGRERDFVVRWEDIVKIGEDVVLVEVNSYTDLRPDGRRGRR